MDVLEDLLLWNVDLFQGFANLLLPQSYEVVERVGVFGRLDVEDFVFSSWVVHSFDSVSANVFLEVKNCCVFILSNKTIKLSNILFENYSKNKVSVAKL